MARQRAGMKGDAAGKDPGTRRQNIVDAALQLFAQKGVAGTSIRDISSLSGESISTVYYYFDDKDDLFRTVMVETTLGGLEPLLTAEQESEGTALDRLRRLLAAYVTFITENPEPAMMLIRGLLRVLEHENTPFIQVISDRFQAIEGILQEGQERGEVGPVNTSLFAYSFFGQAIILFFANLAAESVDGWPYGSYRREEMLEFAEQSLFAGLEASPTDRR
jgi:AcrR family transcriptional regulator